MSPNRLITYVRKNPGILLIVAFLISLVTAGILLELGNSAEAQVSATYGFYFLVVGLLIQLFVFLQEARSRAKSTAERSRQTS
jgi:drug/metabolite transporter superfamily protein YnfA